MFITVVAALLRSMFTDYCHQQDGFGQTLCEVSTATSSELQSSELISGSSSATYSLTPSSVNGGRRKRECPSQESESPPTKSKVCLS